MEVAGAAQEAAKNLEMTRTIILFVTCTRCPSPRRVASVVQTRRSAVFIQFDPVTGSARKCQSLPFGVTKDFPRKMDPTAANPDKRSDQSRAGDLGDQAMPASTCRRSHLFGLLRRRRRDRSRSADVILICNLIDQGNCRGWDGL
jgi:hypothetical protein